ncbi:MAG: nucleoside transporter [Candidatus Omnitrophica bacterium]|nr:nucleoside transporter [Candidatus Omnitrophota bacterium]
MAIYNLISFFGIFVFIFIAWLFSFNRRKINWRAIFWGLSLQFLFALFVFQFSLGPAIFKFINEVVIKMLSFARDGMYFVFGRLALPPNTIGPSGEESLGFILVFQSLPAVIFFSTLMAILYQMGVMQKVVRAFAFIFTKLMNISGAEALCTSSNIVVGIESVFTIRPYINDMTVSELCTILTAGMATVASTVMAVYVSFLYQKFPTIAGHLISASILSAPATIVISKLICPEESIPKTLGKVVEVDYERSSNIIEAIIKSANEGVKLIVGIVALLLSFLGLLSMINWFIIILGRELGKFLNIPMELSLEKIFSFIYYPFSFLMGVPLEDIGKVSFLLGERTILTELVSYQHLAKFINEGIITNQRSIVIVSYALCGFAHIASLAIFVGGISALAPKRIKDLTKVGFRALIGATLACLMTAAIAGIFATASSAIMKF